MENALKKESMIGNVVVVASNRELHKHFFPWFLLTDLKVHVLYQKILLSGLWLSVESVTSVQKTKLAI